MVFMENCHSPLRMTFSTAWKLNISFACWTGYLYRSLLEEYRFGSDTTALVKLEGVDTAERARMFTNIEVYFPVKHAEEAGPGELSWDFFVGFRMEEIHYGKLGEVTDVDTATLNTLFVVRL